MDEIKKESRSPTELILSIPDSIVDLLKSLLGEKIKISDTAWSGLKLLGTLSFIYFTKDYSNTYFIPLLAFVFMLILLEIFVNNLPVLKKMFKVGISAKEIGEKDLSYIEVLDAIETYKFTDSELITILEKTKKKSNLTPTLIDTVIEEQTIGPAVVNFLIELDELTREHIIKIFKFDSGLITKKQANQIMNRYNYDKQIYFAYLKTQKSALDYCIEKNKNISFISRESITRPAKNLILVISALLIFYSFLVPSGNMDPNLHPETRGISCWQNGGYIIYCGFTVAMESLALGLVTWGFLTGILVLIMLYYDHVYLPNKFKAT